MLGANGLGYLLMSKLYWPDFKFDPINLYTIGPAYAKDNRVNLQSITTMVHELYPVQESNYLNSSVLLAAYYNSRSNN